MNQTMVLALLYTLSVALLKCLNFSEPQFLHLKSGTEADDVGVLPVSPFALMGSCAHFSLRAFSTHILAKPGMLRS